MDEQYIRDRITALRLHMGVSEYKMSRDLGHCRGYIQGIVRGHSLPSMTEFLSICEYLEVSPAEFFAESKSNPVKLNAIIQDMESFTDQELEAIKNITGIFKSKKW